MFPFFFQKGIPSLCTSALLSASKELEQVQSAVIANSLECPDCLFSSFLPFITSLYCFCKENKQDGLIRPVIRWLFFLCLLPCVVGLGPKVFTQPLNCIFSVCKPEQNRKHYMTHAENDTLVWCAEQLQCSLPRTNAAPPHTPRAECFALPQNILRTLAWLTREKMGFLGRLRNVCEMDLKYVLHTLIHTEIHSTYFMDAFSGYLVCCWTCEPVVWTRRFIRW